MDTAGGHSGILSMQTQVGRKEWRAVTEGSGRDRLSGDGSNEHGRVNGSARMRPNSGLHRESSRNGRIFHSGSSGSSSDSDHHTGDLGGPHMIVPPQELGRQTIGQGEDASIFEEIQRVQQQNEHLESTMNALSIDSGARSASENPDETLEQRLHEVIRQREQLQQMEVELRAQFIARAEVLRVQSGFDEQTKQQASIVANLQEQLQEREHRLHDLEQQLEERERQLHANQREANEAVSQVWAKDGLLREQNNELGTLRRERDNALAEQKAALGQFEAERAQHLSQLQDLKEQLREKEHQLQELDEQRRSTQDALVYKDEQLRDAQAWMQRAQELDAFHANANSSLHAELRDRTDQINQLWLGYQRQLADVERYHTQTIQRLQAEVAEVREQNRLLRSAASAEQTETKDERSAHSNSKEIGRFSAADQSAANGTKISTSGLTAANNQVKLGALVNGTVGVSQPIVLQREAPAKVEHATGLPVAATPVLGLAPVLPSGPIAVLHQFAGQQQGIASSIQPAPLQITQPGLNQFPNPAVLPTQPQLSAVHQQTIQPHQKQSQLHQSSQAQRYPQRPQQHLVNHQSNVKSQSLLHPRATEHHQQQPQHEREQIGLDQAGPHRNPVVHLSQPPDSPAVQRPNIQLSVHQLQQAAGQVLHHQQSGQVPEQHIGDPSQAQQPHEEEQQLHVGNAQMLSQQEAQQQQQQQQQLEIAAHQHHEQNGQLERQSIDQGRKPEQVNAIQSFSQQPKLHQVQLLTNDIDLKSQSLHHQLNISIPGEQLSAGSRQSASHSMVNLEQNNKHGSGQNSVSPPAQQPTVSDGSGKVAEPILLDERSLLACLVRAIPAESSARIKISTTLPNRLGKMLAPLHWHDYKKQYGRLNEFVGFHPELFIIDGDFIHLREGAHAIISATTAVAKVAAAAAAASPIGASWSPTVAVTPVAQSQVQRLRNSKGLIAPPMDAKQGPSLVHVQATNIQQEGLFPQPQSNGNTRANQGPITRNTVGDGNTSQIQTGIVSFNGVTKPGGQRIMTVLGPRPDGMSFNASNANGGELEKATTNGYGTSVVVNQKNGAFFGNRQTSRTTILGSGPFGKQDFIARPQTQESRISRSSSTAAH